jgi:hypothetical protein
MERSPAAYVNIFTDNNADGLNFPFNDNVQDTILAIKESSTGSPLTDENSAAFDLPFGGVIHPLPYQQASNFRFQCGLIYVAEPGHMLSRADVARHSIIKRLAGKEID